MQLLTKLISPLEKCFMDDDIGSKAEYRCASILSDERFAFQIAYTDGDPSNRAYIPGSIRVDSPLSDAIAVSFVMQVPSAMPVYRGDASYDGYLRTTPGFYPDLLLPARDVREAAYVYGELKALWIEVDPAGRYPAGDYPITVLFLDEVGNTAASETFVLTVLGASLPEQTLKFTQWLHTDCLASYYGFEIFSEEYWRTVERFMNTAVRSGVNMMLTPIFTPPLDTVPGGERPTVQLVDIAVCGDGTYVFGFEKLGRWLDLCAACGIQYYEFSHLFTQWGAQAAPKIVAEKDGQLRRIFGWDTDASSPEYISFLHAFLPALISYMRGRGETDKCVFHISDEPAPEHFDSYSRARKSVEELLKGFTVMDALSDVSFYDRGAVSLPVPALNHIEPFLSRPLPERWTYYCCGQREKVSNRFLAMPSQRNRILGTQMYLYGIGGFLHWGYNFYYSRGSVRPVNPYACTDGGYFVPSGDAFSVYPAPDGSAYETIRLQVFYHALQDMRALRLCESLCGTEAVHRCIQECAGMAVTFTAYPEDISFIHRLREKINNMIQLNI